MFNRLKDREDKTKQQYLTNIYLKIKIGVVSNKYDRYFTRLLHI